MRMDETEVGKKLVETAPVGTTDVERSSLLWLEDAENDLRGRKVKNGGKRQVIGEKKEISPTRDHGS
jgi:hypothetical protein